MITLRRCVVFQMVAVISASMLPSKDLGNHVAAQEAALDQRESSSGAAPARQADRRRKDRRGGVQRTFKVDPGWEQERFPDHAVCYQTADQIAAIYAKQIKPGRSPVTSFAKPTNGSLRILATGHSFMAPGFRTLPAIAQAAGFDQQGLLTHTGGGMTGSARYKWEQENGIFGFDGRPLPKLLSSIANAKWDVMLFGPYYNDRPEFYSCWIDFCLKYNPEMKFFLSDAWPQLEQLKSTPRSEDELTGEVVMAMHQEKRDTYHTIVEDLNERYDGRVYVLPTSLAMVLAVEAYHRGELPGVRGIHKVIGGHDRSLWRDRLGHLGKGMDILEGYVFYATLYRRSPEHIEGRARVPNASDYPSESLDRQFRKIAWRAVINDPLSGVTDADGDGVAD